MILVWSSNNTSINFMTFKNINPFLTKYDCPDKQKGSTESDNFSQNIYHKNTENLVDRYFILPTTIVYHGWFEYIDPIAEWHLRVIAF